MLVHYASKVAAGDFRLARIVEVHPDPHNVTRTVTVAMRPRDSREKVSPEPPHLLPKEPVKLRLGVQRIAVILPVEEQQHVPPVLSAPSGQALNPEAVAFEPAAEEPEFHGFGHDDVQRAQSLRATLRELSDEETDCLPRFHQ